MENINQSNPSHSAGSKRSGRVMGGLLIITVGALLLLRQAGLLEIPSWLFSWEVILILVGLYAGLRSRFRNWGWLILVLTGGLFLADDYLPGFSIGTYLWPLAIIVVGLLVIFRRGKGGKTFSRDPADKSSTVFNSEQPYIESVTILGSVRKNIVTTNFKGGEIVTFFGEAEYNLSQASIEGDVVLEVVQIFGGTRLVIPPHWEVKPELVSIIGAVEDKRPPQTEAVPENRKKLILKGVSIFGGLTLHSY